MQHDQETRGAFIAIVGRPNVGKSSLMNRMVGEKVAIVSPKPQTTRNRILGILTVDGCQLVFFDTPGLHRPHNKLGEYMVKQVSGSIADVDAAILVTEAVGNVTETEKQLMENLKRQKLPTLLAINKIDLLDKKEAMMEKIALCAELFDFDAVIPLSAKTGDGVQLLIDKAMEYAQPGPHFFDDDAMTDQPERAIVAEIIREKVLTNMQDEIPHGVAVGIESMKERPNGLVDIQATIYCERDSHKGMIIGKQGAMLKKIGSQARADIEHLLDTRANLQCWVKVKEDWRNREGLIKNFGYK